MNSCGTCSHEPNYDDLRSGKLCKKENLPPDDEDGNCRGWVPKGGLMFPVWDSSYSIVTTGKVVLR